MKFSWFLLLCSGIVNEVTSDAALFTKRFHWSPTDYTFQQLPTTIGSQPTGTSFKMCVHQPIIRSVHPWKDKLFLALDCVVSYSTNVTFPSLVYTDLNTTELSPPLKPYPKEGAHLIRSAISLEVDQCDRLWLLDYRNLSIVIIDLHRNTIIRQIPLTVTTPEISNIASITVDLRKGDCENAYAYLPNYITGAMLVYKYADNTYRLLNNTPKFVTKQGADANISVSLYGFYSMALPAEKESAAADRVLYAQQPATVTLFTVSANAIRNSDNYTVTMIGSRTPTQFSKVLRYDEKNSVLFYDVESKNSIGCWNRKRFPDEFSARTTHIVSVPGVQMKLVPYLHTDEQNNLWITVGEWSYTEGDLWYNYSVYTVSIAELIKGTVCDSI